MRGAALARAEALPGPRRGRAPRRACTGRGRPPRPARVATCPTPIRSSVGRALRLPAPRCARSPSPRPPAMRRTTPVAVPRAPRGRSTAYAKRWPRPPPPWLGAPGRGRPNARLPCARHRPAPDRPWLHLPTPSRGRNRPRDPALGRGCALALAHVHQRPARAPACAVAFSLIAKHYRRWSPRLPSASKGRSTAFGRAPRATRADWPLCRSRSLHARPASGHAPHQRPPRRPASAPCPVPVRSRLCVWPHGRDRRRDRMMSGLSKPSIQLVTVQEWDRILSFAILH
ncbi:hypothetical protein D1007_06791 [Hordeum vulgare]|nr:hypothetical protein D1007_06791 [Hordeum vulgare]